MSDNGYWAVTLGLGLVVAVVAVILLEMLLRQVHRVEHGAGLVWTAGKQVARNTSTTWLLGAASDRLDALTAEAGLHVALLSPERPDPEESAPAMPGSDTETT